MDEIDRTQQIIDDCAGLFPGYLNSEDARFWAHTLLVYPDIFSRLGEDWVPVFKKLHPALAFLQGVA